MVQLRKYLNQFNLPHFHRLTGLRYPAPISWQNPYRRVLLFERKQRLLFLVISEMVYPTFDRNASTTSQPGGTDVSWRFVFDPAASGKAQKRPIPELNGNKRAKYTVR